METKSSKSFVPYNIEFKKLGSQKTNRTKSAKDDNFPRHKNVGRTYPALIKTEWTCLSIPLGICTQHNNERYDNMAN